VDRSAFAARDAADGGLERAEAPAERDLLLVAEGLPAEEEHRVLVERGDDLREGRVVHALDVDAHQLGAEQGVERSGRQ
jgi:hypothetical protein